MRRIKLVLAVAASMVAMMALLAGPAFAGTADGSCLRMPMSPMVTAAGPTTPSALLIQIAVVAAIAVIAAMAQAPASAVRSPALAGAT